MSRRVEASQLPSRWRRGLLLAAIAASAMAACAGEDEPKPSGEPTGVVPAPLRRLTRQQYDNTVRDLFRDVVIEDTRAASFPLDEQAGPFLANASVPVSLLHVDQYMTAAEQLAAVAVSTENLPALVPCDIASKGEDACARSFVESFGLRAYRRPLSSEEIDALLALFSLGRMDGFGHGIELVVRALLQSPDFLYHVEVGERVDGDRIVLSDYEVASRLSYFLWNTMPDDELLAAARSGKLGTDAEVRAQAVRLFGSDRSKEQVGNFHLQWLGLGDIDFLTKNDKRYPFFDDELKSLMKTETVEFTSYVVRAGDGTLHTLLTAPFSFLYGDLFRLYGQTEPANHDPLTPVGLNPLERAGVLTHPSVMATHANLELTSPVHRGLLVLRNVLCDPMNAPPPEVDAVPIEVDPSGEKTRRELFEEHKQADCARCHGKIDPIGFAFENYDALGIYRTFDVDDEIDVDASTVLATEDESIDGPVTGAVELVQRLAAAPAVHDCMARQWYRFALGRRDNYQDDRAVAAVAKEFRESGGSIRELLFYLATTEAFRFRSKP